MSDWKPDLYLKYEKERTQPSVDLVSRINIENPKRVIDIGCGPGNSTNVLKNKWPESEIIGLDNSEAMLSKARSKYSGINWICEDASNDLSALGKFDIVFSNAAIQWIPEQELLIKKLFGMLNDDGVLAVQVPYTKNMLIQTELIKLISGEKWKNCFLNVSENHSKNSADFYYNVLCNLTKDVELWETNYFHVMDTHSDIVKWYSRSGLRNYLDSLKDNEQKASFINDYETALKGKYPLQINGKVLFPFTRVLFTAKK